MLKKTIYILYTLQILLNYAASASKTNPDETELSQLNAKTNSFLSPAQEQVRELLLKANDAVKAERHEDAVAIYDRLINDYASTLKPKEYAQIGVGFYMMEKHEKAFPNFKQAFQPEIQFIWEIDYYAGRSAYICGKKKKAQGYFKTALSKSGEKPWEVYATAGNVSLQEGDVTDNVVKWFEKAIELIPQNSPERWRVHTEAGVAYHLYKKNEQSLYHFQKALDISHLPLFYLQKRYPASLFFLCREKHDLRERVHQTLFCYFDSSVNQGLVKNLVEWAGKKQKELFFSESSIETLESFVHLADPDSFYKRSSPYWLYNQAQKVREKKVNLSAVVPKEEQISTYTVQLNPTFFQKMLPPARMSYGEWNSSLGNVSTFFKKMIEEQKGKNDSVGLGYLQRILARREDSDKCLPVVQQQLFQCVKAIVHQKPEAQQLWFSKLLDSFRNLQRPADIHAQITRLYYQWIFSDEFCQAKDPEKKVELLLRRQIEEMFYGNSAFVKKLMGLKQNQQACNAEEMGRYLRNVLGSEVGLEGDREFYHLYYQSNKNIVYSSKQKLLMGFYQHLTPELVLNVLKKEDFSEDDALGILIKMGVLRKTGLLDDWEVIDNFKG